jgi:hypothetical protein
MGVAVERETELVDFSKRAGAMSATLNPSSRIRPF